jgi:site-specific DNA recombinase
MNELKPSNRFAAIYVRTSSEHQGEKASPDEQESECRALAQQNNLTVTKVYRDTEKYRVKGRLVDPSGTRVDRPQLLEMQNDATAGHFGYIIAWREDRLYRSMRAMLAVLDTIQDNHIQVLLARETFDPMMAPLKAWVAGMELKGMRERMSMGVKARLRNGKANTGQDRYGYRRNGEVIEIIEEEAKWVRKIFEWYNQGVKLMEIRQRLIELHAPQKGSSRLRKIEWAITSIQSILKAAEAYCLGIKRQSRDGEVFEIPAPPIIDAETYQRFQTVRERNMKHPMFNYRHDYLVSGLLKCTCGRKWASRTQSSKSRKNRKGETVMRKTLSSTYCCTQIHKELIHEDCPRSIGHLKADEYVWGKVKDAIENPEILIAGARDYVDDLRRKAQSTTQDNERIQRELDNLLSERQWVITQARKRSISEQDMDRQLAELSAQEMALKQEMEMVTDGSLLSALDHWEEHAREYFADLKVGLLELNAVPQTDEERLEQFEIKRRVVNTLVEVVMIKKDRSLEVTIRLNLLQLVQRRSSADQVPQVGTYTRTPASRADRHLSECGG